MDVVTFGETMVLFNPETQGPLRYVGTFTKSIGGAESNVAIALARLGHKAGWFSKLGDDEFGRYIKSTVMGEEVDVSRVKKDPKRTTGILFKERFSTVNPNVYYYRKGSAASHLMMEDLDMEYIASAKILHVTGISLALSEEMREAVFYAVKEAKKRGVLISFDPNIRLKLWSEEEARETILEMVKLTDLLFPGKEEAELLLGLTEPEEIADTFLKLGVQTVALKLGKSGCYVKNKETEAFVHGYTVDHPVDTVGAGDGYAAGFISGYLENLSLTECAQRANAVGAMATLVKGDMEGFPYKDQVEIFMGLKNSIDR
ncbi:sugar kinase [Proteiniclasticum ruminis]|uniref:2-dehydro-3-deoxygluconokinase n=1 Tax=Proteiniclasticum ruminis TaxID=398199 RepID=A0A1G8NPD3_9CLOT|nr:sugar kinase [Proteiniclasticum ruminis]SDI82151.1 2-dehydro-3-deoxygluconokinase [Proteiniclasticum ruminis]